MFNFGICFTLHVIIQWSLAHIPYTHLQNLKKNVRATVSNRRVTNKVDDTVFITNIVLLSS